MRRGALPPLAAVALVAAAAAAVAVLARSGDGPSAVRVIAAGATLTPVAALFGDTVQAEVTVALDPTRVVAASVVVAADFGPLEGPSAQAPERAQAGRSVRLRFRYRLACLREACRPREGRRELVLAPAVVRYRLVDGTPQRLELPWPGPMVLGSRLTPADRARPVWRVRGQPPVVSYRVPPALLAVLGYALAALLGAAAVAAIVREALAVAGSRKQDPLAGLTPLERALALVARAVDEGGTAERRRALDRLARELRRAGDDELAADAGRLAWSLKRPERERVAALAAAAAARGAA